MATSSPVPLLARVRSGNVFEETMEHLLRMIRLGQYPPGDRLPAERELAEQLGVSRATLREALGELQEAGYVTVRRGRYGGTRVARSLPTRASDEPLPDPAVVEDVLTLRAVVEPAAARLAAGRELGAEERGRLTAARGEVAGASAEQYRPLDARLHLTIAELAGSPSLVAVVADARARISDLLDRIPLLPTNLEHSEDQHATIVDAVLAGDADLAHEAMRQHLDGTAWLLRGFLG